MKKNLIFPLAVATLLTNCGKRESGVSEVIDSWEARTEAAEERARAAEQEIETIKNAQRELERQLEEQRLTAERDAIERERTMIEERRAEIERMQTERDEFAMEELRKREEALSNRENAVGELQHSLDSRQEALDQQTEMLDQRDQELAGREALEDTNQQPGPDFNVNSVDVFYDSLSPYGSWFDSPDYGYVWRPAIVNVNGWRPYTRGRWACTDRGWMWLSDEPFGWATYHYGRWARCRTNGWLWVPGTEWAPSWVCWRSGSSHIGWAPLPPETLAYHGRVWDSSVEIAFGIGSTWFTFVDSGNFCRPIYDHCLPVSHHDRIWGSTANITYIHNRNNRVICGGPRYSDVQRQTRNRPPFYRIEENRHRSGSSHLVRNPSARNGRIAVSAPRREESRNPDARINRPAKIRGRLDRVEIDRSKPIDSKIQTDFRRQRGLDERRGDIAINSDRGRAEEPRKPGDITRKGTQDQVVERNGKLEVLPRQFDKNILDEKIRGNRTNERGEKQRDLVEHAQNLEKDMRTKDDRIRVLPRAYDPKTSTPGRSDQPITPPNSRGEEQRKLVEHAQDLEKDMRTKDDRVRVLPRMADKTPDRNQSRSEDSKARLPEPPRNNPNDANRLAQQRQMEEARRQAEQAQKRQAEETQRRRLEEAQRQLHQQRQAEESRRQAQMQAEQARQQQQRAAEENARRQRQAAEEQARRQQQQAAEENARRQQRQAAEENARRQQQAAEENMRRQQQQRQNEESQRRMEEQRRNQRRN